MLNIITILSYDFKYSEVKYILAGQLVVYGIWAILTIVLCVIGIFHAPIFLLSPSYEAKDKIKDIINTKND